MSHIYIFGHKNPDSDTICSSLAYAHLKRMLGLDAEAYRLGDINSETRFILQYFKVPEPQMLDTIRTQICDLPIDSAICVPSTMPIRSAWLYMCERGQKSLAVTDKDGRLIGLATLSDITRNYLDTSDEYLLARGQTSFQNIVDTLEARILTGSVKSSTITGRVVIATQHHTKLKHLVAPGDIVIASIQQNIHEAIYNGAAMIIGTCGIAFEDSDKDIARQHGCVIISTEHDTFSAAMLVRQSVPVGHVMTTESLSTVGINELKDDVKERMIKTRFRSYPVIDDDRKVIGMISRYHLLSQARKQVILVDHNEKSQTAAGIEDAEILEIIDHHRLGDIQTRNPILMKNEPLGSTATIIAALYRDYNIEMPSWVAGILVSAIISDTLNFHSPTCTPQDIETAHRLADVADVDIHDLAVKIINAGSNLRHKTPEEIIESDLKEYAVGKYKIGIAQVYSVDAENLADMLAPLKERMEFACSKHGFHLLLLLVTDLNRGGSEALIVGERKDIFYKAFSIDKVQDTFFLPEVLSRKKQVFPKIMAVEEEL